IAAGEVDPGQAEAPDRIGGIHLERTLERDHRRGPALVREQGPAERVEGGHRVGPDAQRFVELDDRVADVTVLDLGDGQVGARAEVPRGLGYGEPAARLASSAAPHSWRGGT